MPVCPIVRVRLATPRRRLISSCSDICRRGLSTTAPNYPPKVRAYPFALSKHEAITHLGPYASLACLFKGFLSSVGARLLGSVFTPLQPAQIQAVYLPCWFLDAEVEADAWVSVAGETTQRTVTAVFTNSYIPGFHFEPLSRLPFSNGELRRQLPIPFSADLQKQRGTDILCLPYSVSPFSLPDVARGLTDEQGTVSNDLRFLPGTVKTNFLATYPVLIPIYLARYEFEILEEKYSVTFILEGFSKSGHIISEVSTFTHMRAQLGMESWWDVPDTNFILFRKSGKKPSFARLSRLMAPLHTRPLAIQLVEWLDGIISEPDAIECLVGDDPLNLDDLRVREYTEEEVRPNRKYMGMGLDILKLKAVTKNMVNINRNEAQTNTVGAEPKTQVAQVTYDDIVASLEKRRSAIKPQWWTDWENGVVRSN